VCEVTCFGDGTQAGICRKSDAPGKQCLVHVSRQHLKLVVDFAEFVQKRSKLSRLALDSVMSGEWHRGPCIP
jgi:hypothetical protein